MFFSIRNDDYAYLADLSIKIRPLILDYPMQTAEIALNNYLIKKYGIDLKHICLGLIERGKFKNSFNGEKIFTFYSTTDNRLAELITYGNGAIKGSNILRDAICGIVRRRVY